VEVLDAMNQEPQREPALLHRLGLVADHVSERAGQASLLGGLP
jgi:hypothetical protein